MKAVLKDNRRYVLRFDKGEEVFASLQEFLLRENISACVFSAIGACSEIELGYYNPSLKDYRKKPFYEALEMVSLIGNGGIADSKPFLHAHGMFSRTDFTAIGGHVFKLLISANCEMFLIKLEGQLSRKLDPETNLKLLE